MKTHSAPQKPLGFTLTELLIVIGVMGIVAMTAIPMVASHLRQSELLMGSQLIVDALTHARTSAAMSQRPVRVTIDAGNDTILLEQIVSKDRDKLQDPLQLELIEGDVEGTEYITMYQPGNRGVAYNIVVWDDADKVGVDIVSAVFGADNWVVFDSFGDPSSDGTVVVASGSRLITVSLNPVNGSLTVNQ